jgi:hypothetical protein
MNIPAQGQPTAHGSVEGEHRNMTAVTHAGPDRDAH